MYLSLSVGHNSYNMYLRAEHESSREKFFFCSNCTIQTIHQGSTSLVMRMRGGEWSSYAVFFCVQYSPLVDGGLRGGEWSSYAAPTASGLSWLTLPNHPLRTLDDHDDCDDVDVGPINLKKWNSMGTHLQKVALRKL